MKKVLLVLIFFTTYLCKAQNYQCLQSNVKHYFTNSNGYLRGIRIDSVRTMGDTTVYYPFHTPRGAYGSSVGDTLDSTGGSWLGKIVLQLNDGTFIFYDTWHDSVIIKSHANLGDSWVFYKDTSNLYYRASVISIDTMTFLGILDTVKTITINAYNGTAIVTTDPVNGFQIILSKDHGFVQVFDLYTFPYHLPDAGYTLGLDYYLDQSIYNPSGGSNAPSSTNSIYTLSSFVSPSYMQLYQWHAGDVYEFATCYVTDYANCACDPVQYYRMDTITSAVNITPGIVNYNFSGWIEGYPSYARSHTTSIIAADSSMVIDTTLMPEEFKQSSALYYYFAGDTSYCITSPLYRINYSGGLNGAVYMPPFEDGPGVNIYKTSLGLVYRFGCSYDIGNDVDSYALIYYNKGSGGCGAKYDAAVPVLEYPTTITLFPNPATTQLTVQSTNELINEVTMSNLLGQIVYHQPHGSPFGSAQSDRLTMTVDISSFPSGVYFVKVNGEVRKFVKE